MPHEKRSRESSALNEAAPGSRAVSGRSESRVRFPRPVAWVVLALSLVASAVGWYVSWKNSELRARRRFDEEAGQVAMALQQRMQVYEDVLHGAAGLFAASVTVERGEWRAYMESVSIERRFPGIAGVGYIHRVPRPELDTFLEGARKDNAPQFQLQDPGEGDDLLVIQFVEPEPTYKRLLGRDIGADPERRAVAERACASGAAALSSPLTLHDEIGERGGAVL